MREHAVRLSSYALTSGAVIALLAGCGGSQTPIGVPGRVPPQRLAAAHVAGPSGSLLYASGWGAQSHGVEVFSYPNATRVASFVLPNDDLALGICSNLAGDVFVTAISGIPGEQHGGRIYEFAHGGSSPIAILEDGTSSSDYVPDGCSVDPTTNNLAVANIPSTEDANGNVAIYTESQGSPALYSDPAVSSYVSPAYDGDGDLFVFGYSGSSYPPWKRFIELKRNSATFATISIKGKIEDPQQIQWDGSRLAILGGNHGNHSHPLIYRTKVTNSMGKIVATVRLSSTLRLGGEGFCIYGGAVIAPIGIKKKLGWELGFWNYPNGGNVVKVVDTPSNDRLCAISVAASP